MSEKTDEILEMARAVANAGMVESDEPPTLYPTPIIGIGLHRAMDTTAILPETFPEQERCWGIGKGPVIPYYQPWLNYLEGVNDYNAFKWLTDRGTMLFNVADLKAESITNHHNFLRIIGYCAGHYAVAAWSYTETPPDPGAVNWFSTSDMVAKVICSNVFGVHRNPGKGWNAYFPRLRKTAYLYVPMSKVELFPALPFEGKVNSDVAGLNVRRYPSFVAPIQFTLARGAHFRALKYRTRGASVFALVEYMGDTGLDVGWIAVLVARKPGERLFYTSWHINTVGVIPPG